VVIGAAQDLGVGNGAEKVAHEAVEFHVGDKVRRLLVAEGAAEHARQAQQSSIAAGQATGRAVGADDFALHAECGGLQGDEVDVLERCPINRPAKLCLTGYSVTKHCRTKH